MEKQLQWICPICTYSMFGANPVHSCPVCSANGEQFQKTETERKDSSNLEISDSSEPKRSEDSITDNYLAEWERTEYEMEEKFTLIHKLAKTGRSEISPMGTRHPFPGFETLLFKGAQFSHFPLDENDPVSLKTLIGPGARFPLELEIPFYVSHMSFGALSREAKIALAMGATQSGTAIGSGEGGMLPEERQNASRYIYEIGTASFSFQEDAIRQAEAVEIKFGQAAKPGMGGHLPAEKMTAEIAQIRGLQPGEAFISPNRQPQINSVADLKKMIGNIREINNGKPVGVKFTAGHIKEDLKFVLGAGPDFVTIDCRGGATGAAPAFIRDHVCLPPIYAIRKARCYLDEQNSNVTLCVAGGFRDSTDVAKAIALGADAVAFATASLIAIGCQQYRICNTGNCPVGIATQDPELRKRFSIEKSALRLANYFNTSSEELRTLARINGRSAIHDLDLGDIFTISNEVAQNTDIQYG